VSTTVERWDTCEFAFTAAHGYANPFGGVELRATWTHASTGQTLAVNGFYDGGSTWRLRFMPTELGEWRYVTRSDDAGLGGNEGTVTCVPPAQPYLHGPLMPRGYHFAHADGTPRFLLSTRVSCHWAAPSVWQPTVAFLKEHRINRVLFIMGGMHGTVHELYGSGPDFGTYDVGKFQAIDAFIDALRRADIIASPYFYYFNDRVQRGLTPAQDRAYLRYGMARFGAYANVMPVLSNEVEQRNTDRRDQYDLASHAWANEMGPYLAAQAVFGVPVTVHNPMETENAVRPGFYTLLRDWPFPWACCMLRQAQVGALGAASELRDDIPEQKTPVYDARAYARHNQLLIDLRRFGVPVVNEEPGYEMGGMNWDSKRLNPRPWNTQTAETLVPTFWTALTAGAYAMWGHAATYEMGDPLESIRKSPTPGRLRALHDLITTLPYPEMEPANGLVSPSEVVTEGVGYRTNFCLAQTGEVYLVFSLNGGALTLELASGGSYEAVRWDPRTGERTELGPVEGGRQTFVLTGTEQVLLCRRRASSTESIKL
jgi:Domain of unknown function (DUF5060)